MLNFNSTLIRKMLNETYFNFVRQYNLPSVLYVSKPL
jgi:hypothetical protein